jgi:hypothetical protein
MAWNQGRRRGGGGGQRSPEAPIPCPQCGGPMWDNSLTKTNPRAPDYQCKDSTCVDPESGYRTAVWASDTQKMAAQGTAAAKGQPAANGKRAIIIDKLMGVCVDAAKAILAERFKTGSEIPPELVVNLATTMYISRTRDAAGIMSIEKDSLAAAAKKAAEDAERKRIEAEAAATRRQQDNAGWEGDPGEYRDDDLPF